MKTYCYLNGRIIDEKNAHINLYDLGVLRGYGVFDFMCTTNNKPFLFNDHWSRLNKSASSLGLDVPISKTDYKKILTKLIIKNPYKNPAIRSVLTAGISENGITLPAQPTFYILVHDIKKLYPKKELFKNGAKIITHNFVRDNFASKTTNYIEAIKKQKERNRRGAIEVLYTDNNTVLECTTANIFIIKNNVLLTPSSGILKGVTRKLVIHLARKNNITILEKQITKKQLYNADEVFITGSAKDILPIVKIDAQKIGTGKPGELTQKMSDLYNNYFNNY